MTKDDHLVKRIFASIAAILISLACGTNYVYSAWGPQFAEKLRLSSTEQNLIGMSANLGMYLLGIPIGFSVDAKGVRATAICGGISLGIGYFALHIAYQHGSGYLPLFCIFAFLTGFGGCAAFTTAIKVSALNWPHHRGTATAFPLAAFGLSAFFFSFLGRFLISGDTGDFLLLLSIGTSGLVITGFFFLRIVPYPRLSVGPKPSQNDLDYNQSQHKTGSESSSRQSLLRQDDTDDGVGESVEHGGEESSALLVKAPSDPSISNQERNHNKDHDQDVDIRGLQLLKTVDFWQLFGLMSILAGTSLMTINNLGNDVKALSHHWNSSIDEGSIIKRQAVQVSTLSICSFFGRIASGIGSDFLVKVLKTSRIWCLVMASLIFLAAQVSALLVENPNFLFLISGPTGLAYGFLYGCFPSLLAETFGIRGLSQNWGAMILSSIISGNAFNLTYGIIYDKHSITTPGGYRECSEGLNCYRQAYNISTVACIIAFFGSLQAVWRSHHQQKKNIVVGDEYNV
ncbi:hypothetical protein K3495_g9412 [Podosphaera aphanis]|nr:hypothetical protein K3495_g9412 [Podosphaera aphanis]